MKNYKNSYSVAIAVIFTLLTSIFILATNLVITKHKLSGEKEFNQYQDSLILALYDYYNLTVDDISTDAEVEAAMNVEDKWLDY